MREWLRPHNCDLAALLRRHRLGGTELAELPWLVDEVNEARRRPGSEPQQATGPAAPSWRCEDLLRADAVVDDWWVGRTS